MDKAEFDRQLYGGLVRRARACATGRSSSARPSACRRTRRRTTTSRRRTGAVLGLPPEDVGAHHRHAARHVRDGQGESSPRQNHSLQAAYVMTKDVNFTIVCELRDPVPALTPDLDRPGVPGAVDGRRQRGQLAARAARVVLPARLRARQPRRRRPAAHGRRGSSASSECAEREHHQRRELRPGAAPARDVHRPVPGRSTRRRFRRTATRSSSAWTACSSTSSTSASRPADRAPTRSPTSPTYQRGQYTHLHADVRRAAHRPLPHVSVRATCRIRGRSPTG